MKEFEVPVRFNGRITYQIRANSQEEAQAIAEEMAENESRLGDLEDVDWDVKTPVSMRDA